MSNFRLKLKKLLESSFNENKKIDSIYHKKLLKNNSKFDTKYMTNNTSNLFFPDKNKTKNNSSQLLGCTVFSVDTVFLTLVALSWENVPLVCSTGR